MRVFAVPRSTPIAFAGKSDPALLKGQRIDYKVLRHQNLGNEIAWCFAGQTERFRHARIRHLSIRHVESFEQRRVVAQGALPALVGELHGVWQGGVGQSECGGAWNSTGHVGDAVVDDVIDDVRGVFMGGGVDRLHAPTLVYRYIDDYGARLHQFEVFAADELRRLGSRNEHRTHDQVRRLDLLEDVVAIGVDHDAVGRHDVRQIPQPLERQVEDGHLGAHARRDLGRVDPHDATAKDHDLGRSNARNAAEENATSAVEL